MNDTYLVNIVNIYATLTLDWKRDRSFEGCNKVLADAVEKLDTQCIEVQKAWFRQRPNTVELVMEVQTSYDDWRKEIRDEDEAKEFMDDRLQAAGLDCRCNINAEESEFVEKSDEELKQHYEETRHQDYEK